MGRRARIFIENTSHFIYLNSVEGLSLFRDIEDYLKFLEILSELRDRYSLKIHLYLLNSSYIALIINPAYRDSIPKFMQALGRRYVRFYNQKYNRRGSLWEGRYRCSPIEDSYLLDVIIYIDREFQGDDNYRSRRLYFEGRSDKVITFPQPYLELGETPAIRARVYREIFNKGVSNAVKEFIEESLRRQSIVGSREYIRELEKRLKRSLLRKGRGRPRKNIEKGKKMYKKLVVLEKDRHKDLKLKPITHLNYAKGLAFIPLLAREVELVAKDFPVVFSGGDNPSLVALVSLGGESLAINDEGKWLGSYIPAYLRRYPFSIAAPKENPEQKLVLIDEESEFLDLKEGEPLFNQDLTPTEKLKEVIDFLNDFEREAIITRRVIAEIANSKILEPREITIGEGQEHKKLVEGFMVIDEEKLNKLDDATLARWVRGNVIDMIRAHLKSLNNIDRLFQLMMQRQSV
jgi:putative transposase